MKKIMLGTSDTWLVVRWDKRTSVLYYRLTNFIPPSSMTLLKSKELISSQNFDHVFSTCLVTSDVLACFVGKEILQIASVSTFGCQNDSCFVADTVAIFVEFCLKIRHF